MNITTNRRKLLNVFTVATVLLNMLLLIAPAAQAAPLAYVADDFLALVRVVDTADNTLLATVNVGNRAYGAAFNATGTRAYVASDVSNELFVQDTSSNRLSADVSVVGAFGNGSSDGSYSVAVQLAGTRIATIPLGDFAQGVAINPAGTRVYVVNGKNVSVIDTASNTVIATVAMGATAYANPYGIAVNPAGTRVYVTNSSESTVSVIDTATNTVITNVRVGPVFTGYSGPPAAGPQGVAVNPNGNEVYVANSGNDTVAVIDTATNEVTSTVPVAQAGGTALGLGGRPRRPFFIAVNPAGTLVYVANSATSTVTTIDAANPCGGGTTETLGIGYTGGAQEFKLFLNPNAGPLPVVGPAPPNLRVTGMEVTQGIQDLANSVRLVSGRRTFVRVYVQSDGAAVPGVTATLSGAGAYGTIGGVVTVPLAAINPSNTVGPRITVSPNPKRSNLNDSFLFELPWEWTNFESLRLKAVLTANPGTPKKNCPAEVLNAPFHYFELFTTLKVQFVRLRYSLPGAPSNTFEEASSGEQRQSESWIRRIYPLSELLSTSDLILFDSGLGARVDRSAKECGEMKAAERSLCAHRYITGRLAALQASSGFMGDADAGYGLIPQTVAGSCAPAADGSMPCFTRGACCTARIGAGPSNSTDYAAHEIGHFLGRNHPVEGADVCGHSATDPLYPYWLSFIGPGILGPVASLHPETDLAGFDGGDANLLIPMSYIYGQSAFDTMGYCKPSWISDYTYEALRTALLALHSSVGRSTFGSGVVAGGPEPTVPQMGDWLMAFGNITPDLHTANFAQTQRVDRVASVPTRTPGNYSIRLIGTGGVTLADYPFTPAVVEDTVLAGGGVPPLSFGQVVPFVADTQKIQIVDNAAGSTVIGTRTVSAHPPTISNVALPGAPDPVTGMVTVGWTASDLDGDPLTFDIFLVRDGGGGSVSLQPLMVGVTNTSLQIDTARLGGGVARFRVVVNDGVQSAFADSPTFNLANKPPRPRIVTPADGTSVYVGQLVNLEGEATDPQLQEGAVPSTTLEWSRPGKVLGAGPKLSVTDLPIGVNQITLTATNSLGLSAATSVTVTVKGSTDLPGPTLTAGPGRIGWHVQVGELQAQTATLNVSNSGGGTLGFTAHSDASWLSLSAATGTAPATLTLTANPAGFAGGVTETATVTLAAAGDPSQVTKIPVTLAVGNTFVVGMAPAVTDTVAPVVTPPADITVPATESGGVRGSASAVLAAFLTGGSAVDAVDPAPTKLAPQVAGVDANNATLLPIGVTTPVSFRFRDASGNVGSATANVTVILGQPRLSGAVIAKGVYSSGILFVDLKLTNTGTGNARNVKVNQILLRTLLGSGTVTLNTALSPAFPNLIGNLNVGASTTLRLYLNLPSTVSRFSLTENGAVQNVAGTGILYSVGQAVTP